MKAMKLFTILFLAMGLTVTSCEKEGPAGPMGAQGTAGAAGAAGPEGAQGTQGDQGVPGENGNANVQAFTFDVTTESGSSMALSIPAVTSDVLENDAILAYLDNGIVYYAAPGPGSNGDHIVRRFDFLETVEFRFHNWDGTSFSISAGTYVAAKIIIIESSSTTAGKTTEKDVLSELKANGIDVKDYYQVADYYGLDY